jgi:hypothetical protein
MLAEMLNRAAAPMKLLLHTTLVKTPHVVEAIHTAPSDYQEIPHGLCDLSRIIKRRQEDHLQHIEG